MTATAQDIMNTDIQTVPEEMTVEDLAIFLTDNEISGAPVIDREGRLSGVVSVTDIVRSDAERSGSEQPNEPPAFFMAGQWRGLNLEDYGELHIEDEGLLVRDIMTPTVYTVPVDTPVQKVAKTMVAGRIHRLLVTRDSKVVGIVTSLDLLRLLSE